MGLKTRSNFIPATGNVSKPPKLAASNPTSNALWLKPQNVTRILQQTGYYKLLVNRTIWDRTSIHIPPMGVAC